MTWNEKMSVGVASCDVEHRKLVALLNEFYDATQAGKAKEHLGGILDALVDYTRFHFANEEKLFAQTGYPDAAAHKKLHDELAHQVLDLQKKFRNGAESALSLEVMIFLKNWLLNHIQGTDKKYGPYLNSKNVR